MWIMPPVLSGSFFDVVVNPASKISEGLKNSFNSMVISLQPESKAPGGIKTVVFLPCK